MSVFNKANQLVTKISQVRIITFWENQTISTTKIIICSCKQITTEGLQVLISKIGEYLTRLQGLTLDFSGLCLVFDGM